MGGREINVVLLSVVLLVSVGCSVASVSKDVGTLTVVGEAECIDCVQDKNLPASFKGLQVAIVCKSAAGNYEAKAISEFDSSGKFSVPLPHDLLDISSGHLKQECFTQLFDSSNNSPCPTHKGLDPFKIVLHVNNNPADSHRLFTTTAPKLTFTRSTCASAFLWPYPKLPLHPWFKKPAPIVVPKYPPVYKKPAPQIVPKYPPVYKYPPVVPKYPPIVPKYPPVYKKPAPLVVPKYPPIVFKKPVPKYPPIVFKKPVPKYPPIVFKKPFPKYPVHPKIGWPKHPKN